MAWYRDKTDIPRLGPGSGSRRQRRTGTSPEGTKVVSAQAPGLEEALERAVKEGTPYVILDGRIVSADRCHEKTWVPQIAARPSLRYSALMGG